MERESVSLFAEQGFPLLFVYLLRSVIHAHTHFPLSNEWTNLWQKSVLRFSEKARAVVRNSAAQLPCKVMSGTAPVLWEPSSLPCSPSASS